MGEFLCYYGEFFVLYLFTGVRDLLKNNLRLNIQPLGIEVAGIALAASSV